MRRTAKKRKEKNPKKEWPRITLILDRGVRSTMPGEGPASTCRWGNWGGASAVVGSVGKRIREVGGGPVRGTAERGEFAKSRIREELGCSSVRKRVGVSREKGQKEHASRKEDRKAFE